MASEKTIKNVERKIYFYRADIGRNEAGVPIEFDPTDALKAIEAIRKGNISDWYLTEDSGAETCCWVDKISPAHRLRLGSVRRSDLPQVENEGKLKPLSISPTSGLVEQIHVMFFPKNIVGCEFNFHGPRIVRLATYLSAKAHNVLRHIEFQPLLRNNALQQLRGLQDIKLFRLKIHSSYIDEISEINQSLGSAFKAAKNVGQAQEIEIVLKSKAHSRDSLASSLIDTVKGLARRSDLHEGVSKFEVRGQLSDHNGTGMIDLLSDQLIAEKRIMREGERSRALNSESAYEAIKGAYMELKEELERAASVS